MGLARALLRYITLTTGHFSGFYRRLGRPSGEDWAAYLSRHRGLRMGRHCSIQPDVSIDAGYVTLGDNVRLSGCALFAHDGVINMVNRALGTGYDKVARITIGSDVFVGIGAVIQPGVTIGDRCIIGANSVITKDVPSGSVVVGANKIVSTFDAHIAGLHENQHRFSVKSALMIRFEGSLSAEQRAGLRLKAIEVGDLSLGEHCCYTDPATIEAFARFRREQQSMVEPLAA